MTIVSAHKSKGKFTYSGGKLTYSATYNVKFTGAYSEDGLYALLGTSGLPAAGSRFGSTQLYALSVDGALDDDSITQPTDRPGAARINYTWSSNAGDAGTTSEDPVTLPPSIEWGGSDATETTHVSTDNKSIVNSAGDLYDPLPVRYIRGGEVSISYWTTTNPANTCVTNSYTTNDSTWNGVAKGNGLIGKVTASNQYFTIGGTQQQRWKLTWPLKFNRSGWTCKLIDNGFCKKASGKKSHIQNDGDGSFVIVPVLLNGSGDKLSDGAAPVIYPTAGYKILEETSWSSLGIPNPF